MLQKLKAEIEVSWNTQQTSEDPNELVVSGLQAENMAASQVTAAIGAQNFKAGGTVSIDNSSFQFSKPDHYLEIASGNLEVSQISNGIDLGIEPLVISFPGLRSAPYNPEDSLVIRFEGNSRIPRSQSNEQPPSKSIDLSNLRLYATNNQLEYNIHGTTENTQDGNASKRTISENDQMSVTVEISGLEIEKAFGVLSPKRVIVNNDDPINGFDVVDLFRESEVEVITIDALSDLSERLEGIELTDPALGIGYLTNIGVPATIYAGILGVNGSGNQVFLKGLDTPGNPHRVDPANVPTELAVNGTTLTPDQLIKFQINPANGGTISDAIQFDRSQTNVDEFLNNLPSHIRFVSVAVVNEGGQEGTITDPVQFDPSMSVDIPLNFTANNASFTDTLETDLSNLPDPRTDNQRLTQTEIYVEYTNGLPLGVSLNLAFLDGNGDQITEISSNPNGDMHIKAAQVEQAGFAAQTNTGNLIIALNEDQLERINETDNMQFRLQLNSTNSSAVKVRATDTISLKISLSAAVESTVN
ncbi:MAG: hypothetical protein U5K69_23945 [Balneolaceae bacterium]|nr:hypothetical protein [Balneolaceae bacterium]